MVASSLRMRCGRLPGSRTTSSPGRPPRPISQACPTRWATCCPPSSPRLRPTWRRRAGEILLAAFGRAVARTVGDGRLDVDVDVDVDVGNVATGRRGPAVQRTARPARRRRCWRPAAKHCSLAPVAAARTFQADVRFSYRTASPGLRRTPATCWRCTPAATPTDPTSCIWTGGIDTRSFDRSTVEELAGQFPLALIELASAAPSPAVDLRWSVRSLQRHRSGHHRGAFGRTAADRSGPSRTERVGPSQPAVERRAVCTQAGWYRGARATARRRPRARKHCGTGDDVGTGVT